MNEFNLGNCEHFGVGFQDPKYVEILFHHVYLPNGNNTGLNWPGVLIRLVPCILGQTSLWSTLSPFWTFGKKKIWMTAHYFLQES